MVCVSVCGESAITSCTQLVVVITDQTLLDSGGQPWSPRVSLGEVGN